MKDYCCKLIICITIHFQRFAQRKDLTAFKYFLQKIYPKLLLSLPSYNLRCIKYHNKYFQNKHLDIIKLINLNAFKNFYLGFCKSKQISNGLVLI